MELWRACQPPLSAQTQEPTELALHPYDELLELKVKALAAGIAYSDIPSTPVEAIVLGWQAKKLEISQVSLPSVEAQLAKLSAVALGRDKREQKTPPKTPEEAKRRAQEERDRRTGEPLLKRIKTSAYFQNLPEFQQAAHVRLHGWPIDEGFVSDLAGLEPDLAREIIALGESGKVPGARHYWQALRQDGLMARLKKTAQQ